MHKGTWLQSQFVFHNGFRGIIENISFGCFTTLRRTTTTSHCRAPVAGTHKWKFQSANFSVHMSVHVFTLAHYRGELWLFHSVWLNAFYVHVRMRSMHYRMGCDRAIGMCIVVGIASAMVVDFSRCRSSFRRILFFFVQIIQRSRPAYGAFGQESSKFEVFFSCSLRLFQQPWRLWLTSFPFLSLRRRCFNP